MEIKEVFHVWKENLLQVVHSHVTLIPLNNDHIQDAESECIMEL